MGALDGALDAMLHAETPIPRALALGPAARAAPRALRAFAERCVCASGADVLLAGPAAPAEAARLAAQVFGAEPPQPRGCPTRRGRGAGGHGDEPLVWTQGERLLWVMPPPDDGPIAEWTQVYAPPPGGQPAAAAAVGCARDVSG